MSRGERSRQERTSEERERDRVERERRRVARSGGTVPPPSDPEPAPDMPAPEVPAPELPSPEEYPPVPDVSAEDVTPDVSPESTGEHPESLADEHHAPPAEMHDAPSADVRHEPPADVDPEPSAVAAEIDAGEAYPDDPLPEPSPDTTAGSDPATEPWPHDGVGSPTDTALPERDAPQSFPIPGIDPPSSPARKGLPPAPSPLPRAGREPMRRAFRRGRPVRSANGPGRGGIASRIGALIALLAVAAAIVLLIHSLTGSSKHSNQAAAPSVVKILIPEGKTRVQIAQIAAEAGLKGSYRAAAHHSDLLNPTHYGAPKATPDLEGFLFPATYELDRGAPAARLVEEQLGAFQENFLSEDATRAHKLGVTPYQLLTIASMIEREAQVPSDRAKIAAVIYNRLKAGMPLGIDASIYYAVEQEKGIATYTHELTESQLKIDSSYNTRTHTGLPPTPISNPGTASIQAAAHPAHVSYLYYVAGADGCGEQVFSDTQAAFETNVAAYEAAKSKNGGHPPACKHH